MTITTTKHPYELLFRWDQSGALSGAHVQWRYVTRDGGAVVSDGLTDPVTVALGQGEGYPLADILSEVQAGAIVAAQTAQAALEDAQRQIEALTAQLVALEAAQ